MKLARPAWVLPLTSFDQIAAGDLFITDDGDSELLVLKVMDGATELFVIMRDEGPGTATFRGGEVVNQNVFREREGRVLPGGNLRVEAFKDSSASLLWRSRSRMNGLGELVLLNDLSFAVCVSVADGTKRLFSLADGVARTGPEFRSVVPARLLWVDGDKIDELLKFPLVEPA